MKEIAPSAETKQTPLSIGIHPFLNTLPRIGRINGRIQIEFPDQQGIAEGPLLSSPTIRELRGITGPTPEQQRFALQFAGLPLPKVNLAGKIAAGLFGAGLVTTLIDISPVSAQSAEEIQINQEHQKEDEVAVAPTAEEDPAWSEAEPRFLQGGGLFPGTQQVIASEGQDSELVARADITPAMESLTPHQKMVNTLREFLTTRIMVLEDVPNPLGLNPQEIEEYANNPNKKVYSTFTVWSKPTGEDSVIIVTGPKPEGSVAQGIKEPENIQAMIDGLNRIFKIDPRLGDTVIEHLKVIAGNIRYLNSGGAATFDTRAGIMFINTVFVNPADRWDELIALHVILVESYHMYRFKVPDDRFDPNPGIAKYMWVNWLLEQYPAAFTVGEKRDLRSLNRRGIEYYTRYPHGR